MRRFAAGLVPRLHDTVHPTTTAHRILGELRAGLPRPREVVRGRR